MKNVGQKLLKIQSVLKTIPKNGYNKHQNYNYVRDEDLSAAVSAALLDNNCLFYPDVEETDVQEINGNLLTTLKIKWTFLDVDSGEELSFRFPGQGSDKLDKGSNKAATGAHKYALIKFFNISSGGQDAELDGDFSGQQQQQGGGYQKNVKQFPKKQQYNARAEAPAAPPAAERSSGRGNVSNTTEAALKPKYQALFGSLNDYEMFIGAANMDHAQILQYLEKQLQQKSEYFKKILAIYEGDKEKAARFVRKQLFSYKDFKSIHEALAAAAAGKRTEQKAKNIVGGN